MICAGCKWKGEIHAYVWNEELEWLLEMFGLLVNWKVLDYWLLGIIDLFCNVCIKMDYHFCNEIMYDGN